MVRSCSLKNCNNSVKQKYRFFLLPSVKKVAKRSAWLKKCGHLLPERLPTHGNSISLCEGHFEPDQFVEYGPNIRTILKPTAVPTIFTRNPPRVCDAIESLYEVILDDKDIVDESSEEIMEEQLTMNSRLHKNDEKQQSECQSIDDKFSPVVVSKPLIKSHATEEKSQSPIVQLLQIKKNCMFMSTRRGNEIIPTSTKEIICDINHQSDNDEINSAPFSYSPPNNKEVESVESIEESELALSSSPKSNKITFITDQAPIMRLCESRKKLTNIQSSKLTTTIENNSECPVTIQSDNFNQNIVHYTVSSTTNIDDAPIDVDECDEDKKNIATVCDILYPGISSSSQPNNHNSITEYVESSINNDQLTYTNADASPITYSRLSMDTVALRKRVHDLEVERDNAMRKYRHLALRLETFETNLRIFLNDDQIRLLDSESPTLNTISWSAETLQKSAKIRCIVGPRAYEYLRSHEHYPLPSFRTLYRHRDISKINEYTDEIIQEHMNSTINEVAAMGAEDSETSDVELDEEHIKIEMLEPEYENFLECQNDSIMIDNNEVLSEPKEIADDLNVMEYVTVNIGVLKS